MADAFHRMAAVARADLLIRVRRPASIAVFLILCALAYALVPDPTTGKTLMQVNGQRALYNSATIALATAGMASLLLGMLGFYLVSNTIRRDITTRTGYIIAAMPVSSAEYLGGKFLGSAGFLSLVVLGYMVNVMGMHLLRGEAPLQALVYLSIYAAVTLPGILVLSALALLFESFRPLSGRIGDVLYFFLWVAMVGVAASAETNLAVGWPNFLDVFGIVFMLSAIRNGQQLDQLSVGHTTFDTSLPPLTYPGVSWSWTLVATRIAPALLALVPLLLAWLCFARFDPARIKSEVQHARWNPLAWLNRHLKPLTRVLLPVATVGPGSGLVRATRSELALSFMLSPLAVVALVGLMAWGGLADQASLRGGVLPVTFFCLIVVLADIACRDWAAGMSDLVYSMPLMRPSYVVIKFATAAMIAVAFVLVPLLRFALTTPGSAVSLLIGAVYIAAAAVSLGILTRGSKTFTGFFLLFLYIALSSGGAPQFDFAGWSGSATNGTRLGYSMIALFLLAAAWARHRAELETR